MIRVLVVEDSSVIAKLISAILNSDPQIQVVGTVEDGEEAVRVVPKLNPDLITMDIHLPKMDGLEATKQIMAYNPTPILILSSSVFKGSKKEVDKVFNTISYGALDVMEKNLFEGDKVDEKAKKELIDKVKLLSKIKVISHPLAKFEKRKSKQLVVTSERVAKERIIGIVASTGGPQAILEILKSLPKDFPTPVLVVQHISSGFLDGFVDWLNKECKLKVKMAENEETIKAGTVYVAPSELHMKVKEGGKIELNSAPSLGRQRPSGTVLLKSIAEVYKQNSIGIILTGMGKDGAEGIKNIHDARGFTIAQDENSSAVFGMPKEAIELGAVDEVLPIEKIANEIVEILKFKSVV